MSTYIAPLALKVDEKTWGTTWRISSDRVIMHVSPEAPPTIPTWYRISEDGQAVSAEKKPDICFALSINVFPVHTCVASPS